MAQGGSNLAGIVKVLVLVVLVYVGVTEGWPWLRDRLDRQGGAADTTETTEEGVETGGGAGSRCVDLAAEASTALGDQLHRFRQPPYDLDAWVSAAAATRERIAAADAACACSLESCATAAAALGELHGLLDAVDSVIRGEPTAFRNPARQQERIDDLLGQARDLARDGR